MRLDHFEEVVVNNAEWHHMKDPHLTQFVQLRRNYQKRWETIIEKGIEQKIIKPLHPYITVLIILAAVRSVEYWHRSKRGITAETLEHEIMTMLNSAIQQEKQG